MNKIYLLQFSIFFILTFFIQLFFNERTLLNAVVGSFIGATVYVVSFHFIWRVYNSYKGKVKNI